MILFPVMLTPEYTAHVEVSNSRASSHMLTGIQIVFERIVAKMLLIMEDQIARGLLWDGCLGAAWVNSDRMG